MNNAVYGQTLMDVTKFSDFEFVNTQARNNWLQTKYYRILYEILYSQCKKCQKYNSPCHDCDEVENCFVGIEKLNIQLLELTNICRFSDSRVV